MRGFGGFTKAPPAKPLIAAVEGYALAGGFEMVLASDLTVAAAGAKFGLPEVKRGLVARGGGLVSPPDADPARHRVGADPHRRVAGAAPRRRAGAWSTVSCPTAKRSTRRCASRRAIEANAPLAVAASKRVVTESASWTPDEWFVRQDAITDPVFASEDAKEGSLAFAEKRAPVWRSC